MQIRWVFLPAAVLYTVLVWTRLGVLAAVAGLVLGIALTVVAEYRARCSSVPISSAAKGQDEQVSRRRRIGLRESFRAAAKAEPDRGGDAAMLATIATAIWYWLRGVPDEKPDHS